MGYQGLKFSEFSLIPEFFPQAGRRQILYPIRPSMGVLLPNGSDPPGGFPNFQDHSLDQCTKVNGGLLIPINFH